MSNFVKNFELIGVAIIS